MSYYITDGVDREYFDDKQSAIDCAFGWSVELHGKRVQIYYVTNRGKEVISMEVFA